MLSKLSLALPKGCALPGKLKERRIACTACMDCLRFANTPKEVLILSDGNSGQYCSEMLQHVSSVMDYRHEDNRHVCSHPLGNIHETVKSYRRKCSHSFSFAAKGAQN